MAQTSLSLAGNASDGNGSGEGADNSATEIRRLPADRQPARIIRATEEELAQHMARLEIISKSAGGPALWLQLAEAEASGLSPLTRSQRSFQLVQLMAVRRNAEAAMRFDNLLASG